MIPKFASEVPQKLANFGIGTLVFDNPALYTALNTK